VQEKLEKERTVNFVKKDNARKLPKVNRELASRLLADLSIHEQTNNDEKVNCFLDPILYLIFKGHN
jgi:hypothetical protein